jgi:Low molecular weight phosphotyrosine protein phosphatase
MPVSWNNLDSVVGRRGFLGACVVLGVGLNGVRAYARNVKRPKILFICKYGTLNSAVAREIFRERARLRGIDALAFSRGLTLEDHVSPELQGKLSADGINTKADLPKTLSRKDLIRADIVVTFNPLPATIRHPDIRDWSDLPSMNDSYVAARSILDSRIDATLDEIQRR